MMTNCAPHKRNLLVAQVGLQPGAVACVVRTVLANERDFSVRRICLLFTPSRDGRPGTDVFAERLKRYAESLKRGLSVELAELDEGGVARAIKDALASRDGAEVFYDCSPGGNFLTAGTARQTLGESALKALYASFDRLHLVGSDKTWPLEDVGLRGLVETLYGLNVRSKRDPRRRGAGVRKNVGVVAGKKVLFHGDLGYERSGRLFLYRDRCDTVAEAKKVVAAGSPRPSAPRPHFLVATKNPSAAAVLRAANVATVDLSAFSKSPLDISREDVGGIGDEVRKLENWLRREPPEPGHSWFDGEEDEIAPQESAEGRGGSWPGILLVCLGNDPVPTLTSVFSVEPHEAWVLYDRKTPRVEALAARMAQRAAEFPVGRLRFIEVGLAGDGIDRVGRETSATGRPAIAVITPGTKAQAWALGRLPGVPLYSLYTPSGTVAPLEGASPLPESKWRLAPTRLAAELAGGALKPELDHAPPFSFVRYRREYMAVAKVVAEVASRTASGRFSWPRLGRRISAGGVALTPNGRTEDATFSVEIVTREWTGRVPFRKAANQDPSLDGLWLEELVAAAFSAAGAEDVEVGLKWKKAALHGGGALRELDVAFQWKGNYVAVSVKQGTKLDLVAERLEAEAYARVGFGRFCLPVLVRPIPAHEACPEVLLRRARRNGVLDVGLVNLGDPATLARLLDDAFRRKRTRAE